MGTRGEDMLVGALCLLLALVNAWRIATAHGRGEVPLYRTRLRRADLPGRKYAALLGFHVAVTGLLLLIAADLLLELHLRGR